jgi:hypothetical protein
MVVVDLQFGLFYFSTNVGLGGADILLSPIDGSVVFAGGAGFSGNTITTFDIAPDPNVVSNLTGRVIGAFWLSMAIVLLRQALQAQLVELLPYVM